MTVSRRSSSQPVMSKTRRGVAITAFLFLVLIPAASPLSFDMSPINSSDGGSFNFSGDAYIDGGIQVTTNDRYKAEESRVGRATYKEALHLWDKASRNLTDFSTHFSFVIDSNGNDSYADGMAFFLASVDYIVKNWTVSGSTLALGNPGSANSSSSSDSFVAVEFDTYINKFDPPYAPVDTQHPHVGININNMSSVNTTTWHNDITKGFQSDAWISYDAASKMLMVEFTGQNSNITRRGSLTYKVDLRDHLPEYVAVGFSAATGLLFETHNIKSWNFSSTLQLKQESISTSPSSIPSPSPETRQSNKGLSFGLSAGLSLLILASAFAFCFIWRKKKKYKGQEEEHFSDSSMDHEFEKGTGPRKFSYSELVSATNGFTEEQKLGEGGFGSVYKGLLGATNTLVAVKKVSKGSKQGRKEYAAEVKIISQLRHINLVQLIGWCHQRAELLLVYEFMPNGSLDSHLFKFNSLLPWEMRYRIAQGLASALLYLHEQLSQYVVHRDIKASNIMLDANFNAKLGDFGLARLVDHDKDSQTTVPAGTMGYMAPEYPVTGRASKETDIYSFGIVLLEIACGRRPIEYKYPQNQIVLVEWVWNFYGAGQLLDAADPKLDSSEDDARKIELLMVVGLWCVHPDSNQRPSIRHVMQVLNFEATLPELPLAMPVAVYDTPRIATAAGGGAISTDSLISGQCSNPSNITTSSAGSTSDFLPR